MNIEIKKQSAVLEPGGSCICRRKPGEGCVTGKLKLQ